MPNPNPSREKDELVLTLLRKRAKGLPAWKIAMRHNLTPGYVDTTTRKVVEADLIECQTIRFGDDPTSVEKPEDVTKAYWKMRGRR